MSEWTEWIVLYIHRFFIVSISFSLSFLYCAMSLGICRPHPMYYYLRDVWKETKYQRDPISLALIAFFIVTISLLQFSIEMKKRHVQRGVTRAVKTAIQAKKNLEIAKMKLSHDQNSIKNKDSGNLCTMPPIKLQEIKFPESLNIDETNTSAQDDSQENVSSSNTLKVARAVSLFGILPTFIFVMLFSFDIGDLRPHGAAAFSMISFGIVVPSLLFARNSKMRTFGFKKIKSWWNQLSRCKRQTRVEPIV